MTFDAVREPWRCPERERVRELFSMACFCVFSASPWMAFPSSFSSLSFRNHLRYLLELPGPDATRSRSVFGPLPRFPPCIAAAKQEPPPSKRAQQKKPPSKKSGNVAVAETRKRDGPDNRPRKKERASPRKIDDDSSIFSSGSFTLPSPPAGFILDEQGGVALMAPASKRVATIVDPATGQPLDCLIRRTFSSSDGEQCFLLCPLDTPVQILRIDDEGQALKELSDEELEEVFPTAAYELAKRRLHLVPSGYCLTLRGGFCYTEDEIMDLNTAFGEEVADSLQEGVEVATFMLKDSEFLVYTPFDPLMFVAYKNDETGELMIAENELLDDGAVIDAIDEEKEFQAFAEEEVAVNESLREIDE